MIEIEMSKDIREFAPKVMGPFTLRQIICLLLAVVIALPILLLLTNMEFTNRMIIAAVAATPVLACGWVDFFGMPLEKFVVHIIKTSVITPTKRKYVVKNEFAESAEQIKLDEIRSKAKETGKNPEKEVAKYIKKKNKPLRVKKSKLYRGYK